MGWLIPPGSTPVGAQSLGIARLHQPGLVAARRDQAGYSAGGDRSRGGRWSTRRHQPPGRELAPPPLASGPESAPPDSDKEPLQGDKNQEPAAGGPAGFLIAQPEEQTPEHGQTQPDARRRSPKQRRRCRRQSPRLRKIPHPRSPRGRDRPRLPGRSARRRGSPICGTSCPRISRTPAGCWSCTARRSAGPGDGERVRPAAVRGGGGACADHRHAEPVRAVRASGTGRAAGISRRTTTRRRRACGSGGTCHGVCRLSGGWSANRGSRQGLELSEDARLVQAVREVAARAGYRGDAFPLLKREKPEWTRERWDRAVEELGR